MEIDEVWLPLELAAKEINRICELLGVRGKDDRGTGNLSTGPEGGSVLVRLAMDLIKERAWRAKHLRGIEFAEPQWDMLLDLYVADGLGKSISVSSACIAAQVPPTTALRHLSMLVSQGAIKRVAHPTDKRSIFVSLSEETKTAMDCYLKRVLRDRSQSREVSSAPCQHER